MGESKVQKPEKTIKLDRKKQALRDNLKKRKAQVRDLTKADESEVTVRHKALKLIQPE